MEGGMPQLVTRNAKIQCTHQGSVVLKPGQMTADAKGGSLLCEPDLVGAPIQGCTQPASSTTKPCTSVVSVSPGGASLTVTAGGKPVYLSTLVGITDGVPPGMIRVADPGQDVASA
jgi:hypothetical protein